MIGISLINKFECRYHTYQKSDFITVLKHCCPIDKIDNNPPINFNNLFASSIAVSIFYRSIMVSMQVRQSCNQLKYGT